MVSTALFIKNNQEITENQSRAITKKSKWPILIQVLGCSELN